MVREQERTGWLMEHTILDLRIAQLTERQRRILRLTAAGATRLDLATRLDRTPIETEAEIAGVLDALEVASLDEAAIIWWGSRQGAPLGLMVAAESLVSDCG